MSEKVSSAELTGLWRSLEPSISHDTLSQYLVSKAAHVQSDEFIRTNDYPLIARKISARAGHIFSECVRLIETDNCDAIISLASGYSLMGFLVSQAANQDIKVIDTDLPEILEDRQSRYPDLPLSDFQRSELAKVEHRVFDIEQAAAENCDLKTFFHGCERPIFVLEGITYFLQPQTRDWLIKAIQKWDKASVLCEYWPENAFEVSAIFKRLFQADMFKERLNSFLLDAHIADLKKHYDAKDVSVGEAEAKLSEAASEMPQLTDPNTFFPIRILTGVSKAY